MPKSVIILINKFLNHQKSVATLIFILLSLSLKAQFIDDFEDADITDWTQSTAGHWEASDVSPLTGVYSLYHTYNNPSAGNDQISVALPAMDLNSQNTAWRFRIKYDYNPSGSNNWTVFLMSDANALQMLPSGTANGYILGVNYTGTDDTLRLWKITSGTPEVVTSTTLNWDDDLVPSDIPAIEVIRTNLGQWQIKIDKEGDFENLKNIGTGTDNTYISADYFGLYYLYTSSADRNLWIDDIYIGEEIKDTIAPEVDSLYILNSKKLKIKYTEKMDSATAVNKLNYLINVGIANPDTIYINKTHEFVELELNQKMQDAQNYSISIQNIEDKEGNIVSDTTLNFTFEYIKPIAVEVTSASQLTIEFSRKPGTVSAENPLNYTLNGLGNPTLAEVIFNDSAKVQLQFGTTFTNKTQYTLTVQNVADQNLDSLETGELSFLYFVPAKHDVVINEIMADPYPEVNLPNEEYIEIKNTTDYSIDLTGWKIQSGSVQKTFPVGSIPANSYLILCSESAGEYLDDYGQVLAFSSFSSIPNSGTTISIYNNEGIFIDSVQFDISWYGNDEKSNGGWSLEKMDPLNTCSGITNWKASENSNGGTPGIQNSVFASNMDNEAPVIQQIQVWSENHLKLIFNEPLIQLEAENKTNYFVNNGIGVPIAVNINDNLQEVTIQFSATFKDENQYILTLKNLSDWCGNTISETNINFSYYIAKPYDVVINEIMADPTPIVNLPEHEYLEIYNASLFDINLLDWSIFIGTKKLIFSSSVLQAGEYVILCDVGAYDDLKEYGRIFPGNQFPSLTNSGQTITLTDANGQVISSISYTENWYKDDYKAEGGWSLEQIDPLNPCGEENNWKASTDSKGGTPGQLNSVDDDNPDNTPPELSRISVINNKKIQLWFNEKIDASSAMPKNIYLVNNSVGNPDSVQIITPGCKSVILQFKDEFKTKTIYELEIKGDITDCTGNEINKPDRGKFALPDSIEQDDIVINEILFNPLTGGNDFVEIYNVSEKVLDIKNLLVASYNDAEMKYTGIENIITDGYLFFPGEYLVLTENTEIVQQHYIAESPGAFLQVEQLPSFNDEEGRIIIMDKWQNHVDNFAYHEDMHFPLLVSNEGVSLERINFNRPTDDKTNWHSASEMVGFATPGYKNSQYMEAGITEDNITIEPQTFSPDNDGFEDNTNIYLTMDEPGYVANIKIFDVAGRIIKYLTNNKLLGINDTISWDGLDEKNRKVPVGVYVVFIELFDLDGNVKQYKKAVVVASKF